MAIPANEIVLKKLLLAKRVYLSAVTQSAKLDSDVDRILAVVSFDMAIETVLRTVVNFLDSRKGASTEFQPLKDQAEELLLKNGYQPLPDKANIEWVHNIRNDTQHKARYPNPQDVIEAKIRTQDFLQKLTMEVWATDFTKLTLADSIKHPKVKEYLVNAEAALNKGDYEQAATNAGAGLAMALGYVGRAVVGNSRVFSNVPQVSSGRDPEIDLVYAIIQATLEDPFRALERMQTSLLHVTLGLNYDEYLKHQAIIGIVGFRGDGNVVVSGYKDITPANVEWVVTYCTNTILQIENRVGDLGKPYGREHWY